jgi:cyclic pyranopterin phosphate synthase
MSLDSLKSEVVNKIAQKEVYAEVMKGIEASLNAGLKIKLNMVPMKGINDTEIIDLLEYAKSRNIPIRFIEYMENQYADFAIGGLTSDEVLAAIGKKYRYKKVEKDPTSPAQYYELEGGYQFGIIEPHKDDFCKNCNRLRLSAEGLLIPCLYFDEAMSIREFIRAGDIEGAAGVLKSILANKPEKNRWSHDESGEKSTRAFYETGG